MNLQQKIEELISQEANDFEVAKVIREEIKKYFQSLENLFDQNWGKKFLVKHTKSIDNFLKVIYTYIIRKYFENYSPMHNAVPIALVALGSYGREQLCVYSDIDLMIVYKDVKGYNTKEIIESVLNMIWDTNLKLGHRVHEIDDLIPASKTDHSIKTALIESRFLCGSKFIWIETENMLNVIRKSDQDIFIQQKLEDFYKREKKYPISMNPNIKSGLGSLRDVNTLFWIANTIYNIPKIRNLPEEIMSEKDYSEMINSIELLYRIRVALHLISHKKQDILRIELVPEVSHKLRLSQIRLSQKTFKAMQTIKVITRIVINNIVKHKLQKESITVTEDIYIEDHTIKAIPNKKCKDFIYLLEYILENISNIKKYDISFINYMRSNTIQIYDNKKFKIIIKKLFEHTNLYFLFSSLYDANILHYCIPPFQKIKYLPQFDGYHQYPVDIHSLRTLHALENIEDNNVKDIYNGLNAKEKIILRVASFLHDMGKGRKKDHSELGALIIRDFTTSLDFEDKFVQYAYLLVKYHTLMSNIASREDIYNDKIIFSFIIRLREPIILKLLYILTYADIDSVGNGTYSNFNARLLKELYYISINAFENKVLMSEASKRARKERELRKFSDFKKLPHSIQKKVLNIESNLLFFMYKPSEISRIASWIQKTHKKYDYKIENKPTLTIEIIRSNRFNLGYLLGKLSNLDIITMDIFKIYNNIKYFKISFLEKVEDEELFYIEEIIHNSCDMSKKTKQKKLTIHKEEIAINCYHSKSYARMSIDCKNQAGLIANFISVFDDIGISIASAKIQTIRNRAKNQLLIEKNGNFCSNQKEIIEKLITKG